MGNCLTVQQGTAALRALRHPNAEVLTVLPVLFRPPSRPACHPRSGHDCIGDSGELDLDGDERSEMAMPLFLD